MKYENLIVGKKEYEFLKKTLSMARYDGDATYKNSAKKLKDELEQAKKVSAKQMPPDVIRLNSFVTIKTPFSPEKTYQLVTPEKSDLKNDKISILTPMGLALYGYAEEDQISWQFPAGESKIQILKVVQEESLLNQEQDDSRHKGAS